MSNSIFSQVNLLSKGLEASWLRNETISNNIANVDTPNYKRRDVKFEEYLLKASETTGLNDDIINSIEPEVIIENTNLAYRMDGNNVDIDVEMSKRAKNEIYYNSLISQVSFQFKQMNTVLNSK